MKSTGIVRKVDELGRIVVPIELRRSLGIALKDPLEIYVEGEQIILQKYVPNIEKVDVKTKLMEMVNKVSEAEDKETLYRAVNLLK